MVVTLFFAGCGKKSETSGAASQPAAGTASTQGTAPAQGTAPTQGTAPASTTPDLAQLNREVRKWILRNQYWPSNFDEFAATANIQIPPPPAGKKYVLDSRMHVILVDN
ncbi:MAG: hypothetical protein ABR955_12315 [Verrucomicrobiota bacterium]|jgi:hypothetical protein